MTGELVRLDDEWSLWPVAAVRGAGMPVDWLAELCADDGPAALRRLLARPAFLAALTWQNPTAVRTWAGAAEPDLNAYRLGVLTRYAQRYCTKNDSIGFFGGVGWASLVDRPGDRLAVTGDGGTRWAGVYLEHWAAHAIADAWLADPQVRGYLPVRRTAGVHLAGDAAYRPFRPPLPLTGRQRAVLDAIDGQRSIRELSASHADAEVTVAELTAAGLAVVGVNIVPGPAPLAPLRSTAAGLPADLAAVCLGRLDALDAALAGAAAVVAQPAALREALDRLDDAFVAAAQPVSAAVPDLPERPAAAADVTTTRTSAADAADVATTRTKAAASAGRTVAYPDCRRDLDVEIPQGLTARLAAPLSLLLRAARWFTAELGEAVDEHLAREYRTLARSSDRVSLADLHLACADLLTGAAGTAVHGVAEDFAMRWREVLTAPPGTPPGQPLHFTAEELEPLVSVLFHAERPGWAAAREHSPDLMLAQLPDGPRWVLGELHLAMNTFESRFFHTLSDAPDQLVELTARDMAGGRLVPGYRYGPQLDSRRYPPLATHVPQRYRYWSHGDDPGPPDGSVSWPATGLLVRPEGGDLVAGPAGGWALPAREFFGEFLSAIAVNHFQLPGPGPRVTVDDLVIRRAGWAYPADGLPPGVVHQRGYRPDVLADRLRADGLPRHLFARIPGEPKPFYVDLSAPALVTNLARAWRRTTVGPVLLQEMLPDPDGLWLHDAAGQRYTTEFRMVAVDRALRVLPGLADPRLAVVATSGR